MFRKARTRVRERSMMRCLKSSKLRHPELPASATVVTPERSVKSSGKTLWSPANEPRSPVPAYTCTWISIRPGVT
jgi:hypothetical protein